MSTLHERLKSLRNEKNFTQAKLAEELNISKSTIAMIETGQRSPGIELLEEIADYFNVDMKYLLGKQNEKHIPKIDLSNPMAAQLYDAYEKGSRMRHLSNSISDKATDNDVEMIIKLFNLSDDKKDFVFNQIEYLYSQEQRIASNNQEENK